MINVLLQVPEVEQYLRSFPRAQWDRCLLLTVRLGVKTAKDLCPYGVTLEGLSKLLLESTASGSVREQLKHLRASLEARKSLHESRPAHRDRQVALHTVLRKARPAAEAAVTDSRSLPKYLQLVESKIKDEVQRDIQRFKSLETTSVLSPKRLLSPMSSARASYPPPFFGPDSPRYSAPLAEPRTNEAFAERLIGKSWSHWPHLNVLRIAEDFLSDPLMLSLSSRNSPKYNGGRG